MTTFVFASGATRAIADFYKPERVIGLDASGRILVNDFLRPEGGRGDGGFLFGLTLCCNASDKGVESGVVCRGCYSSADTGEYYFASHYPDISAVVADPIKEIRNA